VLRTNSSDALKATEDLDATSPDVAVEKLIEAVRNPRNHRYSLSNGIPKLREAVMASLA